MKNTSFQNAAGKKIRMQYFTAPLVILAFCMFFVPYSTLVFTISMGNFELLKWLSDTLISLEVCIVFSLPFIILSCLNRRFFGKTVCVLDERGVSSRDGFIKWESIVKIEYEIDFPSRTGPRFCRAVIYTKGTCITLLHAPLYFLRQVKKYHPGIDAKVSKNSKWLLVFTVVATALIPLLIILLK